MLYTKRLQDLENLTPGDFATVIQQHRVIGGKLDAEYLTQALETECAVKPGASKRFIGFTV